MPYLMWFCVCLDQKEVVLWKRKNTWESVLIASAIVESMKPNFLTHLMLPHSIDVVDWKESYK